MNKTAKILAVSALAIAGAFTLASCSQKAVTTSDGTVIPAATKISDTKESAVILYHGAGLSTETAQGMEYSSSANIVDVVAWKDDVKKAIRKSDGAERTFARIGIDKKDYWIQDAFVAAHAIPGVITGAETVLYKKADLASPSGRTIAINTLVGVHPDTASGDFIAISAYVDGDKNPVISEQFIKRENVDTSASNVRGMQLYTIGMAAKDPVVRKELLKSALATGSMYSEMINAVLDPQAAAANAAPAVATEAFNANLTVCDDNVNVRALPDTTATVLAQLSNGTPVTVVERTVDSYTVGNDTANWYRISDPEGWVFGSFLAE